MLTSTTSFWGWPIRSFHKLADLRHKLAEAEAASPRQLAVEEFGQRKRDAWIVPL